MSGAMLEGRKILITGPCRVSWRDGLQRSLEELYPDRVAARAAC
jgi:hypothetical protein